MHSMSVFAAATVAVLATSVLVSAQFPPAPKPIVTWMEMFGGPGLTNPQIALDMDCLSKDNCYLVGGSNGAGFGVFHYNGMSNGAVTKMTDTNMTMMAMSITAGGSAASPKGAFSGIVDFTIGAGLTYLENPTTWTASKMPKELIWVSTDITSTKSFSEVIAIGEGPFSGKSGQFMISHDNGATFAPTPINFKAPDACSAAGYLSITEDGTWFMSWGNEPPRNNGGSSSSSSSSFNAEEDVISHAAGVDAKYIKVDERVIQRKVNGQVLVIKNIRNGEIRTHVKSNTQWREDLKQAQDLAADNKCNYYKGYILRSTDKGASWSIVYTMPNAITSYLSCYDAQHCTAIAFNADESYTVSTQDGTNWKITYTSPPGTKTEDISVQNVAYESKDIVWVGGSQESQAGGKGIFWQSTDAGATWTKYPHEINTIMVIMNLVFTTDNTGFALGMTMYKTANVLRYAKQVDWPMFSQKQCPIKGCSFLCQTISFHQDSCLHLQGGGSAKAFCEHQNGKPVLAQYVYDTTSCVGPFKKAVEPVNVCLNSTAGNFFENLCASYPGEQQQPKLHRLATSDDKLRRRN